MAIWRALMINSRFCDSSGDCYGSAQFLRLSSSFCGFTDLTVGRLPMLVVLFGHTSVRLRLSNSFWVEFTTTYRLSYSYHKSANLMVLCLMMSQTFSTVKLMSRLGYSATTSVDPIIIPRGWSLWLTLSISAIISSVLRHTVLVLFFQNSDTTSSVSRKVFW